MTRVKFSALVGSVLVALSTIDIVADQTLIPIGSVWRYNDSGTDLGTAWRAAAYNDTGWAAGPAQLGYGDGDEATVISYGTSPTNRRITYYFRRQFTVSSPAAFSGLNLRYVRDDGAVIYLNGTEVVRSNLPSGTISYNTLATTAIGNADESAWNSAPLDPSLLVAGTNTIAVEIHQQSATSSDVSFDLELVGTEAQAAPPSVSLLSPADGGTTNSANVTFRAAASAAAGLSSATLYVGGPLQSAVFSGPAQVEDAQITADTPTAASGGSAAINVDGLTPHAHGLLKFPTLIGGGASQVPAGASIDSAVLQLNCTNFGNMMRIYRLTQSWNENEATWNQRSVGAAWGAPGADGTASRVSTYVNGDCTVTGLRNIDITSVVQEWSNGSPNYGVVVTDTGTDGIDFDSSESANSPVLTVQYRSNQTPVATQSMSGTSAEVSFTTTLAQDQTYSWNVRVTDTLGRQAWAAADFSVSRDSLAPDEPVLVSPPDSATGIPTAPTLSARVTDPGGGPLTARVSLRRTPAEEFTIIALPDTQHYSEAYPAIFTAQTQWIVNNRDARNIVFVTHEGDIVEHYNLVTEWERANTSMSLLEAANIPIGMGPGNHDQPTTLYNQYFPYTRFQGRPYYGGHYQDKNDNNYQLFSGGGMDFVIVHLEFCPPVAAVTWAASIMAAYPDRIGMMTTHGYLNEAAQRTVSGCTSTQYLWDQLAVPSPNLRFMLSGHVHDESRRTDTVGSRTVFQMLADYQDRASGGEGWLRILRFVPADDKVYVQTYSPWLNAFETDANSAFTLDFPMGGAFEDAGTVTVPNGSDAAMPLTGLDPNTSYEWQMTVTNGSGHTRTGPRWTFTTGAGGAVNQPPSATPQSITVGEDGSAFVTLGGSDPEGNPLSYAVVSGPAHGTLSGAVPALTYHPAANYSGSDSFTFRVNDGQLDSTAATVAIGVQAVNDAPVAVGESYSVQSGSTLTIAAPGLLGNDTDIDSAGLTAALNAAPAHGALTLSANGAFSYVPAPGYSGPDTFSYVVTDGGLSSAPATVNLTVTAPPPPPPPAPVISASFNANADGFTYADDRFRGTTQPSYASGTRVASGGFAGGALQVVVGGVNKQTVAGMSGGWTRTFTLSGSATLHADIPLQHERGARLRKRRPQSGARQPRRHAQGRLAQRLRGAGRGQRQRRRRDRDRLATGDDSPRHAALRYAHAHDRRLQQQEGRQVGVDNDPDRRRHRRTIGASSRRADTGGGTGGASAGPLGTHPAGCGRVAPTSRRLTAGR